MRLHTFALMIAALLIPSIATIAKADAPPAHTVTTSGEATVFVTPDEVVVNLGLEVSDPILDKVRTQIAEQAAKLVKAIKALGVDDKCVQTDIVSLEIEYKDNRAWQGIRGYVARQAYSITLKDTKLFEKMIDTALKNGANQINGFEFRTTELRKFRDQARSMAIKAAKEKAVALAKELDCGVGKPWQISEGAIGYFGGQYMQLGNAAQNNFQVAAGGSGGGEDGDTLPLGQIAVRATVGVVFDLTDK